MTMLETFQTTLQPLLTAAGLSWASGLRLYATLAVAGALQLFGFVQLPSALSLLGNPWIVGGTASLAAVEFFMDKIPGLDSLWDSIHTFLRIPAGIALAAGGAAGLGDHWMLLAGLVGGSLAATTHVAKSGTRLMINTSPEPFTNWGASFVEETLWASMMAMMFAYPWAFGAVFAVVLVVTIYLAVWVIRKVRGLFGKIVSLTNPKTAH
jgi:hypothetical protein